MTKTPERKSRNLDTVKTTVRLAPDVHSRLQAAAELNGRSMNAELMARINEGQAADLRREIAELKLMVREVLDLMRDRH